MTDLDDEVRDIFADPPDYAPRALDFDQIMVAGTRLRRRRQVLTAAASVAAAAVLIVGGVQLAGRLGGPGPNRPAPVATVPTPSVPAKAPKIVSNENHMGGPFGALIDTGEVATTKNKLVIYGTTEQGSSGFTIGELLPSGDVTEQWSIFQDTLADDAPGFHATQYPTSEYQTNLITPAFGWYVGKPAKITAQFRGRTVTAKLATWSYRPNVTVFWFDLTTVPYSGDNAAGTDLLGRPHAYNAAGAEMTVGDNTIRTP